MAKLSVNINKIATLRNSRGGNMPDLCLAAVRCQQYGAQGITVHPRPDERHIRYRDVYDLKPLINTEFNIEGFPSDNFLKLVLDAMPAQVTFVPDAHDVLTSNSGWDVKRNLDFLKGIIQNMQSAGIRTSIFVDTDIENIAYAAETGTNRIELYTEPYALNYLENREQAVGPFVQAAVLAASLGMGVNAGHDLNLRNLKYFSDSIPELLEVSIGHALISDAIYLGLENTIQLYLRQLK